MSGTLLIEVEDFGDGLLNQSHEGCREFGHEALHQTAIVDGAQLVDQQIGVSAQTVCCRNTKAKRLGVVHQVGGEGDDQCRGMVSIEQRWA